MRIKKFEADTLQEALARVKKDFGPEAVILHTKKFKTGGIFGVFGRERTEVTAGIDMNVERQPRKDQPVQQQAPASLRSDHMSAVRSRHGESREMEVLNTYRRIEDISLKNEMLSRELNEGKISVNTITRMPRESSSMPSQAQTGLKEGLGRLQKTLIENGVEESVVYRVLQSLNTQLPESQLNNRAFLEKFIIDYLADTIQTAGPVKTTKGTTKVMAMIGPTGVGKTTTIAKLAAHFALMENKRVVMVSADTYRIAADLQLKKYGDIMGIPVEIVLTPEDFLKVINKHIDKDIILFDTAGRSPRNKRHLAELKDFLEVYSPIETHIVLSAVTKYFDALSMINNFGLVPIHRILFTKLDETKNYGLLLNLSLGSGGIPISYLSVGQTVPDDLQPADKNAIARLVVKGDFEAWIRQKN